MSVPASQSTDKLRYTGLQTDANIADINLKDPSKKVKHPKLCEKLLGEVVKKADTALATAKEQVGELKPGEIKKLTVKGSEIDIELTAIRQFEGGRKNPDGSDVQYDAKYIAKGKLIQQIEKMNKACALK